MTPAERDALLTRHGRQLDDLEQTVADLRAAQAAAPAAAPTPSAGPATPFLYERLPDFVEGVIAPLYAAHLTGGGAGAWCPRWFEHTEARIRLGAVWRAWEVLRLDPTLGIAKWLRDVADPQMDRLRDRDRSPFRACSDDRHLVPEPLPCDVAPDSLWDAS